MLSGKELLKMMKLFIDGVYDAEEFSFHFEEDLHRASTKLKEENYALYHLLTDEMPETCANFESHEAERLDYQDLLLSEQQMRDKTKEVYQKALELL